MEIKDFQTEIGQCVRMTELYDYLELSKAHYSIFVKRNVLENPFADENSYSPLSESMNKSGRFRQEYAIHIDFAKKLCMVSKSKVGEKIRNALVEQTKKVETHKLLDAKKMAVVYTMINTFKFGEYQIEACDLHENRFRLSYKGKEHFKKAFSEYRSDILSINNAELKEKLIEAFNRGMIHKSTAKNIRDRIALLDRYKLLRDAVADYLVSTGANVVDAINFADTVKEVAQFAGVEIRIKDEDTLFDKKENVDTPLKIELGGVHKLLK